MLDEIFSKEKFIRILVHLDIADEVLRERVKQTKRNTNIFRMASSFEEVLDRQREGTATGNISDPVEGEADYLFYLKEVSEIPEVIQKIVQITDL